MKKLIFLVLICIFLPVFLQAQEVNTPRHLKVGVYDNPPKIFVNKNGNPDGIFIDIIKSIIENEAVTIEYVTGNWSDLFAMLKAGELDILPDMASSRERDSLFHLSTPVLSSWLQVFTTSSSIINKTEDLHNKRIGVLKASSQEEFVKTDIKRDFNIDYTVMSFDTYTQSVIALKNNEIDALIANRFFYFSKLCDHEILPTGVVLQISTLHFAFSKAVNLSVVELFNKKITLLINNPGSAYYRSIQKWFNKHKTIVPIYIKWIIVFLAVSLIVFLLFTVVLRSRVKAKTRILKQQNLELTLAKEKAEESDQLKTVFLQNLSHEIRTPMNGILGFINLLQEPHLNDESQQQYFDLINKSSERLLSTINDIIEISRIESNQLEVNLSSVNISELLESQFNLFQKKAQQKRLDLRLNHQLSPDDSLIVTDETILNGIFSNLVNNALKFTNQGFIEIGCYADHSDRVFYVKDTGIGIQADRTDAIFDRFVHADLKLTRPHEGSGLGLAIVKAYIEKLNGTIWVESEPEKGSVFYFKLALVR